MKKTILALSLHINKWGAERSMCEAMASLQEHGFRVVMIITSSGPIEDLLKYYNIQYFISPMDSLAIQYHPKFCNRIKRTLVKIGQTLRHNNSIYRTLKENGIHPDYVYTNTLLPLNGIFISRHYNAKHILHIREFMEEDFGFRFLIWDAIYLRILKYHVCKVICISKAIYTKFHPYFGEKAQLLYNGVYKKKVVQEIQNVRRQCVNFVFVGRISEEKGILDIINGFKALVKVGVSNIHLDVWGTGPLEKECMDIIKTNNLQKYVTFCGYSDNINLSYYDVGLMASRCEGFGRTTVEYMLSALAVIGFKGGATVELVDDGVTGFLYNSHEAFLSLLKQVSSMKEVELKAMGVRGMEKAERCYSQDRYLREMVQVFKNL